MASTGFWQGWGDNRSAEVFPVCEVDARGARRVQFGSIDGADIARIMGQTELICEHGFVALVDHDRGDVNVDGPMAGSKMSVVVDSGAYSVIACKALTPFVESRVASLASAFDPFPVVASVPAGSVSVVGGVGTFDLPVDTVQIPLVSHREETPFAHMNTAVGRAPSLLVPPLELVQVLKDIGTQDGEGLAYITKDFEENKYLSFCRPGDQYDMLEHVKLCQNTDPDNFVRYGRPGAILCAFYDLALADSFIDEFGLLYDKRARDRYLQVVPIIADYLAEAHAVYRMRGSNVDFWHFGPYWSNILFWLYRFRRSENRYTYSDVPNAADEKYRLRRIKGHKPELGKGYSEMPRFSSDGTALNEITWSHRSPMVVLELCAEYIRGAYRQEFDLTVVQALTRYRLNLFCVDDSLLDKPLVATVCWYHRRHAAGQFPSVSHRLTELFLDSLFMLVLDDANELLATARDLRTAQYALCGYKATSVTTKLGVVVMVDSDGDDSDEEDRFMSRSITNMPALGVYSEQRVHALAPFNYNIGEFGFGRGR